MVFNKMKAKCFECGKELEIGKTMEELIELRLPLFCCTECSTRFPNNNTNDFDKRFEELKANTSLKKET